MLSASLVLGAILQGCTTPHAKPSAPQNMQRVSYPSILGPAVGPYSDGVKHNGFLYLSGLSAFGSSAQGQPVAQQIDQILSMIEKVAQAEGTSLRSLVKVTIFVTDMSDLAAVRAVLFKHYGKELPASSLVRVAGLFSPEVNAEIEAVIALPDDKAVAHAAHSLP